MESTWWVRTQLDVIIWLQQHELVSTYQLHHPIALYSLLASGFIAYAAIVAFWCRYPRTGFKLMRILGVSAVVMGCMKMAISWPRPSWLDERVRMLDPTEELSFAFPSGHVFATTAVAGIVALLHPSRAKLPLAMLLVVSMMISRVFTGAHFVHDVIGGAALGTLLVWLEIRLTRMVKGGLEFEHRHPWWGRSLVRHTNQPINQVLAQQSTIKLCTHVPSMRGRQGVIAVASLAIICSTRITLEGRGRAPELLTGFTTCLGLLSIPHLARLFGYVNFEYVVLVANEAYQSID